MPLPVVFILSSNYSGSHLLASALGAHSACADVGEVANLRKFRARSERPLSGTRGRFVTSPLFDGLPELPEGRWLGEIHERLAASGRPAAVLVDNSKRIEWVKQAISSGTIEPRLVHLIRDPRALARRWRDTFRAQGASRRIRWREAKRSPRRAVKILSAPETGVYGWRWLRENARIASFVAGSGAVHARITYESLCSEPESALRELMAALGLGFEGAQLQYGASEAHGTTKPEWSHANAASQWAKDERWLLELDNAEQDAVMAVTPLTEFLASIGYRFGPLGLEQIQ